MNDTDLPFYDTARPPFDREPPSYAVHGRGGTRLARLSLTQRRPARSDSTDLQGGAHA
jgi:hypothetical protein